MKITNYKLKAGKKLLLDNVNVDFYSDKINVILGSNGCGKSTFVKDLYNNCMKYFDIDKSEVSIVGSYTKLPMYLSVNDILSMVKKNNNLFDDLYNDLQIGNISTDVLYKELSDGQKQKIKVISLLKDNKQLVLLDELTNAVDKKSSMELCNFISNFNEKYSKVCVIYITHNLSDLKNMKNCAYFLFSDQDIVEYSDEKSVVTDYIGY